jgi:hypothetical protein
MHYMRNKHKYRYCSPVLTLISGKYFVTCCNKGGGGGGMGEKRVNPDSIVGFCINYALIQRKQNFPHIHV